PGTCWHSFRGILRHPLFEQIYSILVSSLRQAAASYACDCCPIAQRSRCCQQIDTSCYNTQREGEGRERIIDHDDLPAWSLLTIHPLPRWSSLRSWQRVGIRAKRASEMLFPSEKQEQTRLKQRGKRTNAKYRHQHQADAGLDRAQLQASA